jgi:hypothetical protein
MILIRGAVSDALFERVYNYDKQFRLRIAQNPIRLLHCHLKQSSYSFLVHWVHQNFDVTTRQDLCTEVPIFFPLNFD